MLVEVGDGFDNKVSGLLKVAEYPAGNYSHTAYGVIVYDTLKSGVVAAYIAVA